MRLSTFVPAAALSVGFIVAASAADIPVRAPVYKAPPAQVFSWTGCYAGGNAGGIFNDSSFSNAPSGAFLAPATLAINPLNTHSYKLNDSAFVAGVQYGCQRQFGTWVVGIDSDFDWTGINETITTFYPAIPQAWLAHTDTVTQKLHWLSTTRAKLGWALDRWMIFAAGGLAVGRVSSSFFGQSTDGTFFGSDDTTRYGWTIGGGIEYAFSQNWFLRGEYLYVDLGKTHFTAFGQQNPIFSFDTELKTREHVARVALSYRFTTAPDFLSWAMSGFRY